MPTYVATGRDTAGKTTRRKVEADSPADARTLIKSQGMHIQNLKEEKGISFNFSDFQTSMTKVTVKDKAVFSRQFAALVSFTYNVGSGALNSSTLLRRLNAGDTFGAANEFLRWNRAGGRVLAGLTRRRREERALFLS